MAVVTPNTKKYLHELNSSKEWWVTTYYPADIFPVSGIYRCKGCGKEITSNKDDKFPPQNRHQHSDIGDHSIRWQLIVRTDTNGDNCGAGS